MKLKNIDLVGIGNKGIYILKMRVEFKKKNSPISYVENRALWGMYLHKNFLYVHLFFITKRICF